MRNSSLVEYLCTEDLPGLKHDTEFTDSRFSRVVEERSVRGEAAPRGAVDCTEVSMPVLVTIRGENPLHHLTKVSRARVVLPGLVGS